ncbi:MAG: DUF4276 family protein [Rhodospirillales bacterium]|nr:DUF4276 family protein [Rhodospirillales bacterium]
MHFEVLVEDASGKIALSHFLDKILGPDGASHTRRVIEYKGIGSLPRNLDREVDRKKKILLNDLPSLLRGYGRTFRGYGPAYSAAVIVVCDLDQRNHDAFTAELEGVLNACDSRPETLFLIAVEEGEAWLLGDRAAVEAAYPDAKSSVLDGYVQDSICGTWEVLADAVHSRGAIFLKGKGYPEVGIAKGEWAKRIAPLVNVDRNQSPSFQRFRDEILSIVANSASLK